MKRDAVFSKSLRPRGTGSLASELNPPTTDPSESPSASKSPQKQYLGIQKIKNRSDYLAVFLFGILVSLLCVGLFSNAFESRQVLTQKDIDAAVGACTRFNPKNYLLKAAKQPLPFKAQWSVFWLLPQIPKTKMPRLRVA
jgi:hypothetical protein